MAANGKTVHNVALARTGSTTLSCNMPRRAAAAPLMRHWESPPVKGKRPLQQVGLRAFRFLLGSLLVTT